MINIRRLLRWFMPLVSGIVFALLLGLLFYIDLKMPRGGLAGLVTMGLKSRGGIRFGITLVLRELLPIFSLAGLLAWLAFFIPGIFIFGNIWSREWRGRQGFAMAFSGVAWVHAWYWWMVPSTLWVIPGPSYFPLFLALPLLGCLALLPGLLSLKTISGSWTRRLITYGMAILLWTGLAELPLVLSMHTYMAPSKGTHPVKILTLAIDGLRADVASQAGVDDFHGMHFPNAYSPLPATRLLYHLLWGGDPNYYSVGHVVPSRGEFYGRIPLRLLDEAKAKGWKVRFCIDDGGTIGLSGRSTDFDAIYMPARGWENFVNSNLAVRFPLYAAWMDVLRVFPSTNPWSCPNSALIRTLEVGRGADWVMLHSCFAHQPIFLSRKELGQIPGWWKLAARDYEPRGSWQSLDQRDVDKWRPERNPALAYKIRMTTLVNTYREVWNKLDQDPDYRHATRIFFSDHGERFYHVTEKIQLQGVHGFGLDPWEMRIPLIVKTPDGPPRSEKGTISAISLLNLRDGLQNIIQGQKMNLNDVPVNAIAPGRYHTIASDSMRPSDKKFREQSKEEIITATYIYPDGIWMMDYSRTATERSKDVTLARAFQDRLTVFKPLVGGGAQKSEFKGYSFMSEEDVSEEAFQLAKKEIESIFLKTPDSRSKTKL